MKWLLSIGAWAVTAVICAALGFIVGLFYTPSLDEGSHGLFIPMMFGLLGLYWGIPVGLIVALVWLVRRSSQERRNRELMKAMIDSAGIPIPASATETPGPSTAPASGLASDRGAS